MTNSAEVPAAEATVVHTAIQAVLEAGVRPEPTSHLNLSRFGH
jgi:hypothetical protein